MLAEQFAMDKVYSFEIDQKRVNSVRRGAYKLDAQVDTILKEYDYLNDRGTKSLNAAGSIQTREYQSRRLVKCLEIKGKISILYYHAVLVKPLLVSVCITVNKVVYASIINDVAVEQ